MSNDLPETLVRFIHDCTPTYQSAEVLLFIAAAPERDFSPEEIVVAMRPVVITVPTVKEYLSVFKVRGVITESDGRFRYGPSLELERRIAELAHAYNERPVSLVRAIYNQPDNRLQAFADSFKLRKD